MQSLPALIQTYIDSNVTTSFTAVSDTYYVVDTAIAAVTITLPIGVTIGHQIVIQNAPATGPQLGGVTVGHNITVNGGSGETVEGGSDTIVPPTTLTTPASRKYFPVGSASSNSGFGAGWVGL